MTEAEADAFLDSFYNDPKVEAAAQEVMDAEAAERAEKKAAEKRAEEMRKVLNAAAGVAPEPPAPPKPEFEPIKAYTAAELRAMDLKAMTVIVDGLLPAGFSLLAGAPKRGKSWMALDLAYSVATGKPFLGRRTMQGRVLYLDLESGPNRAQSRMGILVPGQWPDTLSITHRADLLGDNGKLLLQIEDWLNRYPDTRLIIIDTIGRVKGAGRRGENAYETDTRTYGALQQLAMERGVAIIGIHHYRKGVDDGDDWFEKISGSMGLTGVCDTVMALTGKREEQDCILKTSSRDFEGIGDIVLRFDGGTWVVQGTDSQAYAAEKAYRESGIVRGILALMDAQPEWQGEPSKLLDAITQVYRGQLETYAVNKFGAAVDAIVGEIYERDGVVIRRQKVHGRRILLINKSDGGAENDF